jgi:dTDP-4-dehydrorhamnose reductase
MRLLITGAGGLLGAYLLRELVNREGILTWGGPGGGERFGRRLRPIDLTDTMAAATAFRDDRPDVIVHVAALARVADCWRDPQKAWNTNVTATSTLAELAEKTTARLVYVSTDLVFDGEHAPYRETDEPMPGSAYGRSKRAGEDRVLAIPRSAVARVSLLYGPSLHGRRSLMNKRRLCARASR